MVDKVTKAAAEIVIAFFHAQPVPVGMLSSLISHVHGSLSEMVNENSGQTARLQVRAPAIDPRNSVFRDHLVCLEDGTSVKMLKKHLRIAHGLSPEEYRIKWGLPPNYPLVAPAYAETRSRLAKQFGLGRTGPRRPTGIG
jgi:predicted transcriptional regulator